MFAGILRLLGLRDSASAKQGGRAHILADRRPARLYAIGDIHGCLAELLALEQMIEADAEGVTGEKWIVTLGDYIDRGPASAAVIAHLMAAPPTGFKRIALAGNHEQMLLDFLDSPSENQAWLDYGGWDTARSYGFVNGSRGAPRVVAGHLRSLIPPDQQEWLAGLPIALAVPGYVFVHAGIRQNIALDEQSDFDLMWIREPFLNDNSPSDVIVVHGHTPELEPVTTPSRIGIDTGAFATGRLTALRLDEAGNISFLSTKPGSSSLASDEAAEESKDIQPKLRSRLP